MNMTIPPTLDLTTGQFGKNFMVMFRYKFDENAVYTDEVIQKMNGIIHASISSDASIDVTDANYFKEFMDMHFVTTRFKLRPTSHTPINTASYSELDKVTFVPPFSTQSIFSMYTVHEYRGDSTGETGGCNFSASIGDSMDIARRVSINRVNTIKGVPVTIKMSTPISFGVTEMKIANTQAAKAGTSVISWQSSIVGYVKQMDNFARDNI